MNLDKSMKMIEKRRRQCEKEIEDLKKGVQKKNAEYEEICREQEQLSQKAKNNIALHNKSGKSFSGHREEVK